MSYQLDQRPARISPQIIESLLRREALHACLKPGTVVPIADTRLLKQVDVAHFVVQCERFLIPGEIESGIQLNDVLVVAQRRRLPDGKLRVRVRRDYMNLNRRILGQLVIEVDFVRGCIPSVHKLLFFCL